MTPDQFRERWPSIAEIPAVADLLAECDRLGQFVREWRTAFVIREIDEPDRCSMCGGAGAKGYANTGTWASSVGGAVITEAICDVCWGSGRRDRPWANLREWQAETRALRAENERLRAESERLREQRDWVWKRLAARAQFHSRRWLTALRLATYARRKTQEAAALRARYDRAVALLREFQTCGDDGTCPECEQWVVSEGHSDDCALAAVLREASEKEGE